MRELKFSYMYQHDDTGRIMDKRFDIHEIELGQRLESFLPRYTLFARRQYTGLSDKNGVEIYKGDIIKASKYPFYSDAPEMKNGKENPTELNYLGVVGINYDGSYYDLKAVSYRVRGSACGSSLSEINDICEVIGNIYENPELLHVQGRES